MNAADKREIGTIVAEAVAAAMQDRAHCRFSEEEAALVHQLPRDLDRSSLILLGRVGRCLDSAATWLGRIFIVSLFGVAIWFLAKAIKNGWLGLEP